MRVERGSSAAVTLAPSSSVVASVRVLASAGRRWSTHPRLALRLSVSPNPRTRGRERPNHERTRRVHDQRRVCASLRAASLRLCTAPARPPYWILQGKSSHRCRGSGIDARTGGRRRATSSTRSSAHRCCCKLVALHRLARMPPFCSPAAPRRPRLKRSRQTIARSTARR